jgi:hypothetical protein
MSWGSSRRRHIFIVTVVPGGSSRGRGILVVAVVSGGWTFSRRGGIFVVAIVSGSSLDSFGRFRSRDGLGRFSGCLERVGYFIFVNNFYRRRSCGFSLFLVISRSAGFRL